MPEASERFYKLIWPHAAVVLRVAQTLFRNPAEADDLAQETMLKAFRSLDQFREGTDAKAWLLTILRNTRVDRLRSSAARKELASLDEMLDPPAVEQANQTVPELWSDPAALLENLGDQQIIDAMLELPEEIRWSLLLVDVEGLEMKDAAEVMQIPTGTVKSRLHRGRQMLRQALEPVLRAGR